MSPTEADLRAALGDGEGEPDGRSATRLVQRVIAQAAARRVRRRNRLLAAAAAVVVVGGIGVGLGFAAGRDTGTGPAGSVAGGESAAVGRAGGASPGVAASGGLVPDRKTSPDVGVSCPARLARYVAPAGGGQEPARGGGTLFERSVPLRVVVICAYSTEAAQRAGGPTSAKVTGALAQDLGNVELEPGPTPATCNRRVAYALVGRDVRGRTSVVPIVPTTRSCDVVIGDRFQGPPPQALAQLLARLAPPVRLSPPASGVERGKPPR